MSQVSRKFAPSESQTKGVCATGLVSQDALEPQAEGEHEDDTEWLECWSEVSGKPLDPELARNARREDIAFI